MVDTVLEQVRAIPLATAVHTDTRYPDTRDPDTRNRDTHLRSLAAERYGELLYLPTDTLRRHAVAELRAEAALPPDQRRAAARARLAAWLELDGEETRVLARVYDEAARTLPRDDLESWLEAERDAMLHGLSFSEFTRLADMVPWLRSRLGLLVMGAAAREAERLSPAA